MPDELPQAEPPLEPLGMISCLGAMAGPCFCIAISMMASFRGWFNWERGHTMVGILLFGAPGVSIALGVASLFRRRNAPAIFGLIGSAVWLGFVSFAWWFLSNIH